MDVRLLTTSERAVLAQALEDCVRGDRSVRVAWRDGLLVKFGGGEWSAPIGRIDPESNAARAAAMPGVVVDVMPLVWFVVGSRAYQAHDTRAEWNGNAVLAFTRDQMAALIAGGGGLDSEGDGLTMADGLVIDRSDGVPSLVPMAIDPAGREWWIPEGRAWESVDVDGLARDAVDLASSESIPLSRGVVRDVTRESDYPIPAGLVDAILARAREIAVGTAVHCQQCVTPVDDYPRMDGDSDSTAWWH